MFREILQIDKFEGVDFKSDNSFFKVLAQKFPNKPFLAKNTKIRHFCSQIYTFLFYHKISQLDKFKGADFQYDKKNFLNSNPKLPRDSIFGKKYWNKAFLVQNLSIFVSSQNLELEKFEGDDFRYDNSFLKF